MGRTGHYATKQGDAVLNYLVSLQGGHATAEQIAAHFAGEGQRIGLATIYRQLERLAEGGWVRKCVVDGASSACYQCVDRASAQHFHLKCERCGSLQHLVCGELDGIAGHIFEEHHFRVNATRTVFYGRCERCLNEG